ncbi:hypothetical protein T484DRAFT_1790513 [Baffinella frigidus]|nr:hypothetical protein T484DRAFT_1790513 [Cryptophyta sp. CCMP2293]
MNQSPVYPETNARDVVATPLEYAPAEDSGDPVAYQLDSQGTFATIPGNTSGSVCIDCERGSFWSEPGIVPNTALSVPHDAETVTGDWRVSPECVPSLSDGLVLHFTFDDAGLQNAAPNGPAVAVDIDDVRLYNRILSATEVAALCPRDMRGLIFHAPYDVDAGDYSGHSLTQDDVDVLYGKDNTMGGCYDRTVCAAAPAETDDISGVGNWPYFRVMAPGSADNKDMGVLVRTDTEVAALYRARDTVPVDCWAGVPGTPVEYNSAVEPEYVEEDSVSGDSYVVHKFTHTVSVGTGDNRAPDRHIFM